MSNCFPEFPSFADRLIAWQRVAGRHDLPWQGGRDPYRIWLSEIMLQQTQVATVIPYFHRFLAAFPDVRALAAASPGQVMALWAGLGYYARARNLHRCAAVVVGEHGGAFPGSAAALAALPGIGRSTASAIAAFAFGERAAILDGNVKRVLCRYFGVTGDPGSASVARELWQLAESLLPVAGIVPYTQGLMDLGATVCTRRQAACAVCPVAGTCVAARDGRQAELPERRAPRRRRERHARFLLLDEGASVLLERRPPRGIWGGLLVPPEGEVPALAERWGFVVRTAQVQAPVAHDFTHFRLWIEVVHCRVAPLDGLPAGLERLSWERLDEGGLPAPMRTLLRQVASAAG